MEAIRNPDTASLPPIRWLTATFSGLHPLHWDALVAAARLNPKIPLTIDSARSLLSARDTLLTTPPSPTLMADEAGTVRGFSLFPVGAQSRPLPTISDLLVAAFGDEGAARLREREKTALRRRIETLLLRARRKAERQEAEERAARDADRKKEWGDLLLAYCTRVPPRAAELPLPEHNVIIPLDPTRSPQENARRYYKEYRKGKAGVARIGKELEKTRATAASLEEILVFLDGAERMEELDALRQELDELGLAPTGRKPGRNVQRKPRETVMRFRSPDGLEILVGKNRHDNELILRHLSGEDDLWFHARGLPGSHVLLKSAGPVPPQASLETAAQLAAYYSKGRTDTGVEVDYTMRKHVRKISGGGAGNVTYREFRTIRVAPRRPE